MLLLHVLSGLHSQPLPCNNLLASGIGGCFLLRTVLISEENQNMRTPSRVMEMFYILIGVRVTQDFPFVKTVHLRFVHINLNKFYLKKKNQVQGREQMTKNGRY